MTPWLQDPDVTLYHGDCLEVLRTLPDRSVHMCATSPPFYGLRDYGTGEWEGGDSDCNHAPYMRPGSGRADGIVDERAQRSRDGAIKDPKTCGKCGARRVDQQIGLEETPDQWVDRLVQVFREVRRVLRDDGTLWVEIGDSYAGGGGFSPDSPVNVKRREQIANGETTDGVFGLGASQHVRNIKGRVRPTPDIKAKDMIGQPWLLAFALRADGWWLRSEIIWARPNPMPESVTDRPTKSHSTVFLLSKQPRYFYDADAIREPHQHDGRHVTQVVGKENSEQHRNGERWPGSGANARSVWTIPTEPTPFAHFATWPQALVRRMILAGTSERGCCPECGAPWVRETERGFEPKQAYDHGQRYASLDERHGGGWKGSGHTVSTTLGWSQSCSCVPLTADTETNSRVLVCADPVPCTVLDPFAGSGTTLLVARQHGRHSIGIELNEDYCRLVADRTRQQSLLAEGAA